MNAIAPCPETEALLADLDTMDDYLFLHEGFVPIAFIATKIGEKKIRFLLKILDELLFYKSLVPSLSDEVSSKLSPVYNRIFLMPTSRTKFVADVFV